CADFSCALVGCFGERAHFVGYDRETPPMLARPRRLDRRIACKKIGLVRDPADALADLADIARPPLEFGDDLDQGLLALRMAFDGSRRCGCMTACEHRTWLDWIL